MAKYKKIPVTIEAWQFKGNITDKDGKWIAPLWLRNAYSDGVAFYDFKDEKDEFPKLMIKTLEGNMHVSKDDYIIKGVNGELYPCKPDIFEKTYVKVEY